MLQDVFLLVKDIVESHPKLAHEFFLDKKHVSLYVNLLRSQTIFKININDITTIQSLVRPLKGLTESLLATSPVIELLIEAEIKSVFSFRENHKKSILSNEYKNGKCLHSTHLLKDNSIIHLEDFCAYFKPIIETRPKMFLRVFEKICRVGEISFKKILTADKEKYELLRKNLKFTAPNDDFVFRKSQVVELKDGVKLDTHDMEGLKSQSMLIMLLFKDILFKLNKKSYLCKTLSKENSGQSSKIKSNNFIFDEYKISEILFLQILPRYPCFYTLFTKKQKPVFIHFFEKSLKHTFLFSKFLDPILIDSYFMIKADDFDVSRPLAISSKSSNEEFQEMIKKSKTVYGKMIDNLICLYTAMPMNLILRLEIIRVYINFYFENAEQLMNILDSLNPNLSKIEIQQKEGTLEIEQKVYDCLKNIRNTSLSLFMTSKLINWFNFLEKYKIIDLFIDYFEFLAVKLTEGNFFKKDLVLKFLNFPVFARRAEVR
jgi:hypothetical protein